MGRGLNAAGSAFANHTRRQNTQFSYKPRSGTDIAKGIPQNPDDTKKISTGQQKATGINRVPMDQIDTNQLITLFKDAAGGGAVNPTKNAGVDNLLTRAGLLNTPPEQQA